MAATVSIKRLFTRILACAAICLLCNQTHAQNVYFENMSHYGIDNNDFDKMHILPVYQMENDTLFLAAKTERDTNMNLSQRLINNRWLLEGNAHSYSGSEALRRYLKMYFLDQWGTKRSDHDWQQRSPYLPVQRRLSPSQFKDLSNYRVRLSNDKVNLRFKYSFE